MACMLGQNRGAVPPLEGSPYTLAACADASRRHGDWRRAMHRVVLGGRPLAEDVLLDLLPRVRWELAASSK